MDMSSCDASESNLLQKINKSHLRGEQGMKYKVLTFTRPLNYAQINNVIIDLAND